MPIPSPDKGGGLVAGLVTLHRKKPSTTETTRNSHSNIRQGSEDSGSSTDVFMKDPDQSRKDVRILRHPIFNVTTSTKIGTWNVRTMFQCGKRAQVLNEMSQYKLDVLGVSEMRWPGQGSFSSEGYTILYSGKEDQHTHGVGIILNQMASKALISWNPVNHRLISARLGTQHAKISLVQVYAPTEAASDQDKDEFYGQHYRM